MGHDDSRIEPVRTGALGAGLGAVLGMLRAIWADVPVGRPGRHTPFIQNTMYHAGRTSILFATSGAAYAFTKNFVQDCRQTGPRDLISQAAASTAAGAVIGLNANSVKAGVSAAAFLTVLISSTMALVEAGKRTERHQRKMDPYRT